MTRLVALLTAIIIIIAVAAALLLKAPGSDAGGGPEALGKTAGIPAGDTPNTAWLQEFAVGALEKLAPAAPATRLPIVTVENESGRQVAFTDMKGKVLLVNFWATWCAPCRHEMPSLDALEAALGGPDFAVVPISIDRGGKEVAARFFAETGIKTLPLYLDPTSRAARALKVYGLPVTLLVDASGHEIARFVGPADWASAEAQNLIRALIQKTRASRSA